MFRKLTCPYRLEINRLYGPSAGKPQRLYFYSEAAAIAYMENWESTSCTFRVISRW